MRNIASQDLEPWLILGDVNVCAFVKAQGIKSSLGVLLLHQDDSRVRTWATSISTFGGAELLEQALVLNIVPIV